MQSVFSLSSYDEQRTRLPASRTRREVMIGSLCLAACSNRKDTSTAHKRREVCKNADFEERECKTVALSRAAIYTAAAIALASRFVLGLVIVLRLTLPLSPMQRLVVTVVE
jgi:hypothetical protein